jgi:hypothetical protein
MKLWLFGLGIILSFSVNTAQAQYDSTYSPKHWQDTTILVRYQGLRELLYAKGHFGFRTTLIRSRKGSYTHLTGNPAYAPLELRSPGWSLTLDYTFNLSPNVGIRVGYTQGTVPAHYRVKLYYPYAGYPNEYFEYKATDYIAFREFPLEIVYRIPLRSSFTLEVRGGTMWSLTKHSRKSYTVTENYTAPEGRTILVRDLALNNQQLYLNFPPSIRFGVGMSYRLPGCDLIGVHLTVSGLFLSPVGNSPSIIFFPDDPAQRTEGETRYGGRYIGLEFSYTYTQARSILKRVRTK